MAGHGAGHACDSTVAVIAHRAPPLNNTYRLLTCSNISGDGGARGPHDERALACNGCVREGAVLTDDAQQRQHNPLPTSP